jgi:hypothetical protein
MYIYMDVWMYVDVYMYACMYRIHVSYDAASEREIRYLLEALFWALSNR